MRQLFFKLLLLFTLILVSCIAIIQWSPIEKDTYLAATIDKQARLAELKNKPKLILVGGSNVAFGVDSRQLEARYGLPVINMAVHVGQGLRYMLNEVKPFLHTGDVVVVIPEYMLFYGYGYGLAGPLFEMVYFNPGSLQHIDTMDQMALIATGAPLYVQKNFKPLLKKLTQPKLNTKETIYFREAFNPHGDMTSHVGKRLDDNQKDFSWTLLADETFTPNSLAWLNDFTQVAKSQGATVLFTYPSVVDTYCQDNAKEIATLEHQLHTQLQAKVLGQPKDFCYPKSSFYNTMYHLSDTGREKRTQDLMRHLDEHLVTSKRL